MKWNLDWRRQPCFFLPSPERRNSPECAPRFPLLELALMGGFYMTLAEKITAREAEATLLIMDRCRFSPPRRVSCHPSEHTLTDTGPYA